MSTILSFLSRGCWRDIAGGRDFSCRLQQLHCWSLVWVWVHLVVLCPSQSTQSLGKLAALTYPSDHLLIALPTQTLEILALLPRAVPPAPLHAHSPASPVVTHLYPAPQICLPDTDTRSAKPSTQQWYSQSICAYPIWLWLTYFLESSFLLTQCLWTSSGMNKPANLSSIHWSATRPSATR